MYSYLSTVINPFKLHLSGLCPIKLFYFNAMKARAVGAGTTYTAMAVQVFQFFSNTLIFIIEKSIHSARIDMQLL